jgi:chromosomal replication initiation ATPase DnaA
MYIAKKYFRRTLEKIWMYFWGKNHAAVIYAISNIEKKLKSDEDVQQDYQIFSEWAQQ